jgi:hypothetical protein
MYKLTTGVLLSEKNEKFGNLSNFISAKKKKVDKTRKAWNDSICQDKRFGCCSIMLLVASTSRRPIELASIASGSIKIYRENGRIFAQWKQLQLAEGVSPDGAILEQGQEALDLL